MSFVAALDHLHGLGQELSPSAPRRKFDLAHMRILATALGDPQTRFPTVLIAGTNGKGSTAATLASILAAAGYRTGLYTSPHLARVTERIRIAENREQGTGLREQSATVPDQGSGNPDQASENRDQAGNRDQASENEDQASGNQHVPIAPADPCSLFPNPCSLSPHPCSFTEISEDTFARLYFRIDETAQRLVSAGDLPHHPSFFEYLTALAFLAFAERQVDIAIVEVGLGGRLDATNIAEPILSVITDIALDHQEFLGNTITEIAREKAGILRPNGTLITLPQHPEANQSIGEVAMALNVRGINAADYLPGRIANREQSTGSREQGTGHRESPAGSNPTELQSVPGSLIPVPSPLSLNHYDLNLHGETLNVRSPLAGEHQRRNLALAIAAAIELRNKHSYIITNTAIEEGIANTAWPGRLEFLPPNLLLDVAHNPAGAWTLRAAIATLPESQPRTLIFSCLRDKDLTEMARILFPLFDSTGGRPHDHILFAPINNPRAASLDELTAAARALDTPAQAANSVSEALALARSLTPADGLVLATGSIYLVGALREAVLSA
jgi:dihydrofolate synthase/folylpolyglutamate synthase